MGLFSTQCPDGYLSNVSQATPLLDPHPAASQLYETELYETVGASLTRTG